MGHEGFTRPTDQAYAMFVVVRGRGCVHCDYKAIRSGLVASTTCRIAGCIRSSSLEASKTDRSERRAHVMLLARTPRRVWARRAPPPCAS
eukprot:scaffold4562_cov121-Isochrysis_galbana.AAC.3